jgi:putative transposase
MTKGLVRYYGTGHLHFITGSCYRRQSQLHTARRRDLFLRILEQTRRKYRFVVHGYVVMPEHFHLLITEPEAGDPSVVMKVVKQRYSRELKKLGKKTAVAQIALWVSAPEPVWQKRFYDFIMERAQTDRETTLHASQSGEAGTGGTT